MLRGLFFLARTRWKLLPKAGRRPLLPYAEVKSIGILFGKDAQMPMSLLTKLEADGKELYNLQYLPNAVDHLHVGRDIRRFDKRSMSFFGLLDSHDTKMFLSREYDVLINANPVPCPYLEHVQMRCRARLKVRISTEPTHDTDYHLIVRSTARDKGLNCTYKYLRQL